MSSNYFPQHEVFFYLVLGSKNCRHSCSRHLTQTYETQVLQVTVNCKALLSCQLKANTAYYVKKPGVIGTVPFVLFTEVFIDTICVKHLHINIIFWDFHHSTQCNEFSCIYYHFRSVWIATYLLKILISSHNYMTNATKGSC